MRPVINFCLAIFLSVNISYAYASDTIDTLHIPDEYGKLADEFHGNSEKVVFVISDLHSNLEAQKSISNIIEYLTNYYGVSFIGVEGARGNIDTEDVSSYYNATVRQQVCSYYMRKAFLGGAVFNDITANSSASFYGMEDKQIYEKQFSLYTTNYEKRTAVLEQIGFLDEILYKFKKNIYPQELFDLEESYQDYHSALLSLIDFGNILLSIVVKYDISFAQYPNLMLLNDIRKIEGQINYDAVETELSSLITTLRDKIGKDINAHSRLKELIDSYDNQYISEDEYYDRLYTFILKYKIDSSNVENIWHSIQRAHILKKIDSILLFDEINNLYPLIQLRLIVNYSSSLLEELLALSNALDILKRVVTLNSSSDDVGRYFAQKDQFSSPRFISFIRDNAMKYNVGYRINPDIVQIERIDELLSEYYDISRKRSTAMFQNFIDEFNKRDAKSGVIVVGKFHVKDIINECRARNITCISINPYVPRLRETIDIPARLRAPKNQIDGYIMSYVQYIHLKPWETLATFEFNSDTFFRYLLNIEYFAHDIAARIALDTALNDEAVTRAIYLINEKMNDNQIFSIKPLHVIELEMIGKRFIDIQVGEDENALRFLIEPLDERDNSYADETVSAIAPLNIEQLDRGLFRSSDRLLNILEQQFDAKKYSYNPKLVASIKKEIEEEREKELRFKQKIIKKIKPQLIPDEDIKIIEEQSINDRLMELKAIEGKITGPLMLDDLNNLENEFVLLKSQLSFYQISNANKEYIDYLEQKIDKKIEDSIDRMKELAAQQDENEKLRKKQEEAELRMKEAIEHKQRRKKVDDIVEKVSRLKGQIDTSQSLASLSEIENEFNEAIQELTYTDLIKEDRVMLNAFKISWEAKYSIVEKESAQAHSRQDGEPAISSTTSDLIRAFIQQAFNLKEIVDFSSIPRDAEYILVEYNKMKEDEYYLQLSSEEKKLFDTIGPYIEKTLDDLRKGKKKGRHLSLTTLSFQSSDEPQVFKIDDYFTEIYELRNRVVTARSQTAVEKIYDDFNSVDKAMKKRELTDRQKSVLADTERLITEGIKHFEKENQLKKELTEQQKCVQHEIEKEALLKELLGEKAEPRMKSKVFFIEGNVFERELVKKRLEKEGFLVEAVDSFKYDNTYFIINHFDIILLDDDIIDNTTGLDFVLRLKRNEIHEALPPIMIHSNNSTSWLYGFLKRNGITRRLKVYITSKRNLSENVQFIKDITS